MRDSLGKEINVGDYVVYATRVSNSGQLLIGKVLEVTEDDCTVIAGRSRWINDGFELNSKKSVWSNEFNLLIINNPDIEALVSYAPD